MKFFFKGLVATISPEPGRLVFLGEEIFSLCEDFIISQTGLYALSFKVTPVFYLRHSCLHPGNENTEPAAEIQQDNQKNLLEFYMAMTPWAWNTSPSHGQSMDFVPLQVFLLSDDLD